jgi:L-iditol 2-dehydrogenase
MSEINRCAYLDSNHNISVIEKEIPQPGTDEIVIKIVANGICGSDIHFYNEGRLGNFIVTEPYIPGHEASGTITKLGKNVKGFSIGERVVVEPGIPCGLCAFCRTGRYNLCGEVKFLSAPPVDGTFCDYVSVRWDCVHKIPMDMPFEDAALVEPAAVAIHAVNRAVFKNGDTALVIGAGPIGLLMVQAFKAAGGSKVICMDRIEKRLETAAEVGADEVLNIDRIDYDLCNLADVVFETAGSSKATQNLFKYARPAGCAVQVGWPNGNVVPLDIADLLDKEITYVGVNRYASTFPTAISWIRDGRINAKKLITHRYSLDRIAEAFKFSTENARDVIKTIVLNDSGL